MHYHGGSMTIGSKLYRTQTTDDSMAWAKEHIHTAPDGSVFLADQFTHAQGRQGRTWSIHPGQLLVTLLLKPAHLCAINKDDLAIRLNQLTMAMSLGILDALKPYGVGLKWPNDFMVHGKKVGGVLMHVVWIGEQPTGIVVGFAINVNTQFPATDPLAAIATSLFEATEQEVAMRPLYKDILTHLDAWYKQWKAGAFMHIYKTWKLAQLFIGKAIQIHNKDGSVVDGIAHQVMPNGDLILITSDKKQMVIPFYQVEEVHIKS
jgi:BirA family transcriptional regulator, biotin operon repressor / biotin---[acetyl-CoA-carboxylase] ligase